MKICKYCKQSYKEEEFEVANYINGRPYRRLKCKKCYLKDKKRRSDLIAQDLLIFKSNSRCEICGISDVRVLQYHHIKNDKLFNVSDGIRRGYSLKTIISEIEKCKVLCANCHSIEHWQN